MLLVVSGTASAASRAGAEAIWALLADGAEWKKWDDAVRWVVFEGGEAGGFVTICPKRGRQTAFVIEDVARAARLVLRLTFGPLALMRTSWTIVPDANGSRIEQSVVTSGPLAKWLVDPYARKTIAVMPATLARLADVAAGQ